MPTTKSSTKRPATVAKPEPTPQESADMARAEIARKMEDAKLAKSIADDRAAGMKGDALRQKYGEWLTGPRRCRMLRQHGYGEVIGGTYDRDEAKAKREAEATKPARKRQPRAKAAA